MYKYNLIDILSKEIEIEEQNEIKTYKFDGLQIPMIQRDYAQGRENESEIRKRFINSIFNALERNQELKLDFVYGSIKSIDNKKLFIPLDGQQRLTTLYLLYWYIGNRELRDGDLENLRAVLACFNYATRPTAEKFCRKMSNLKISFQDNPGREIEKSAWFFDSFKKDPTIKSMLVMLDAIHKKYGNETRNLYAQLSELKFYILPLGGFELSDELYIKMNARGKQLTDYENFKADLINWLSDDKNPFKKEFNTEEIFDERKMPYYLSFATKLDNVWSSLFWNYYSKLNVNPEEKIVDPYLVRFWNRYLLNSFITNSNLIQDAYEKDEQFLYFYGNQGNDSKFKYDNFDFYKLRFENDGLISAIAKTLDNLTNHFAEIKEIIKPAWKKTEEWSLFDAEIIQRQRILFYAVTMYCELNQFDSLKFKNWIRVVWNLIIDPNIRSVPAMVGAMKFMKQLSVHSNDIYSYLKSTDSVLFNGNGNYQTQIEEERLKAILIDRSEEWEILINEAESHFLFKGNINFLFTDNEETTIADFIKNKSAAFQIFDGNDLNDNPPNYLWVRATLAKDSFTQLPLTLSNGRFDNWRYLINGPLMDGIRKVIKEVINSQNLVTNTLIDICNNYQRDDNEAWKYPLVHWLGKNGETLLGNYSETRKIQKYNYYGNDPYQVYLYNKNVWTDSNIILSSYRNELIQELLANSSEITFPLVWHNIQNCYFRGWDVKLYRLKDDFHFIYYFDREYLNVGILSTPELIEQFKNISLDPSEMKDGWVCRKAYNYNDIQIFEDIKLLIQKIEEEVFDNSKSKSLISKIRAAII